jgi:hypothetical protein
MHNFYCEKSKADIFGLLLQFSKKISEVNTCLSRPIWSPWCNHQVGGGGKAAINFRARCNFVTTFAMFFYLQKSDAFEFGGQGSKATDQGCQMVYFQTKSPNSGKFFRV